MTASAASVRMNAPSSRLFRSRLLRRLASDRSGVTVIEFAILVPLFIGLVFMIAQIGLYFYFSTSLYYVTGKATREILTGAVANQGLTAAQYRNQILCPLLPGSMSCSNIITNIQVVPAYGGTTSGGFYSLTNIVGNPTSPEGYTMTGLTPPPMNNALTNFCIGSAGSIIAAQVYYAMPVIGIPAMFAHAATFNGQSVIFISATSVFKNEPFTSSNSGC
jgi:Flp pilus assembly protein TadG